MTDPLWMTCLIGLGAPSGPMNWHADVVVAADVIGVSDGMPLSKSVAATASRRNRVVSATVLAQDLQAQLGTIPGCAGSANTSRGHATLARLTRQAMALVSRIEDQNQAEQRD